MREILFRGKRIDHNGKWIDWAEGLLDKKGLYYYIDTIPDNNGEYGIYQMVDPDSIGEFTGLTDKNGKKIFEGDIVYDNEENGIGVVEMSSACWVIRKSKGKWDFLGNRVQKFMLNCPLEVIGNIFDNPELLEIDNNK